MTSERPSSSAISPRSAMKFCFPRTFFCSNPPLSNAFTQPRICTLGSPDGPAFSSDLERTALCSHVWLVTFELPQRPEATRCCQRHPSGGACPRFRGISRVLGSTRLFPPFFFARILLFLNLFPVGLFTAAVYKHRANQNERAIADTLDLPVQPQRNKTLRPSPVCPPPLPSLRLLPAAVLWDFRTRYWPDTL